MTESQTDLVLHLLQKGRWSDAIATYCDETGVDQETAAIEVRSLAQTHNMRQPRWSLFAFLLSAALACLAFCLI